MYTPPRTASLLIAYLAFVAGTCAACHFLLATTAATYMSAPQSAAAKTPTSYSRVDGWLKRQSMANLSKPAAKAVRVTDNAGGGMISLSPERDVAHAVVMAAALDNTEHNRMIAAEARQLHARLIHRRVRVPSCQALPCSRFEASKHETAQLKPHVVSLANVETLRVAAGPGKKVLQKSRRAVKAAGAKIASKSVSKLQKPRFKSKIAEQERLKSDRRIALRRFRETPAEISYRSYVGSFVPAT